MSNNLKDKKYTEWQVLVVYISGIVLGIFITFMVFYANLQGQVCGEVAMDSSDFEELFYRAYDCEYDKITFEYTLQILDKSLNLSGIIQSGELNSTETIELIMEMNEKHVELNEEFNFFEEPLGRIRSDYYVKSK